MKKKTLVLILMFCFGVTFPETALSNTQEESTRKAYREADMIIKNGKIITVDQDFSMAKEVAVKDGKIVAVSKTPEDPFVKKWRGPNTKTLDLRGKTMLPGIHDAHLHLSMWMLNSPPFSLDLFYPTVESISDIVKLVAQEAAEVDPGTWINGFGWDEGFLKECLQDPKRTLTKEDLDGVSPDNPVALYPFSGHALWVNSKALELAGISAETPDPPGGVIVKNPVTREPTGILKENAVESVASIIPPPTEEQTKQAMILGAKQLNALGITSITDAYVPPGELRLYTELNNERLLTIRSSVLIYFGEYAGAGATAEKLEEALNYIGTATGFGDEMLQIAGLKIFADGIPPQKTSWFWDEYIGGGYGSLVTNGDTNEEQYNELIQMIRLGNKHRLQVGIHATGDRAIDACVDGFILALEEHPWDARHYTIHSDFVSPETAAKMAKYGILANVQSLIKWTIADFEITVLGPERAAYEWPVRTLLDAGVIVTDSSDAPVTIPNWLQGVETAVSRESKGSGQVSGPDQRITRKEAIQLYTINGAYQDHQEDTKGSIEAGKVADFCVLDKDILTVDAHEISDIPVLMTILGGKIVHNAAPDALYLE